MTAWNPDIGGVVYALAGSGSTVYVGGAFDEVNGGTPRHALAAFAVNGNGSALPWAPSLTGCCSVQALDVVGGTIYIGGDLTTIDGVARSRLAAIGADGVLTPWNPQADDHVYALAHVGSTVYVGGGFRKVNGNVPRWGAAAFESGGTGTVTGWDPHLSVYDDLQARIFALAPTASAMYLGGDFVTVGDCAASCLASPNLVVVDLVSGEPLSTWEPSPNANVLALGIAP